MISFIGVFGWVDNITQLDGNITQLEWVIFILLSCIRASSQHFWRIVSRNSPGNDENMLLLSCGHSPAHYWDGGWAPKAWSRSPTIDRKWARVMYAMLMLSTGQGQLDKITVWKYGTNVVWHMFYWSFGTENSMVTFIFTFDSRSSRVLIKRWSFNFKIFCKIFLSCLVLLQDQKWHLFWCTRIRDVMKWI